MSRCPLCECPESKPFDVSLVECRACDCIYQQGSDESGRDAIFAAQVFSKPDEAKLEACGRILAHLQSFVVGRRLFDVGFGDGATLIAAAEREWSIAGIDLAPAAAAWVGDHEDTIRIGDYLEIAPETNSGGARYDVISFFYSLEQMRDPRRALRIAHELLDDDGLVCIELVPMSALRSRSADSIHAQLPTRLLFADVDHVRELLWTSGFRIEEESEGIGWRWIARRRRLL